MALSSALHAQLGTVDGRGYNGHQKYSICDACGLHTKASFLPNLLDSLCLLHV